jgi:hypothetical protein
MAAVYNLYIAYDFLNPPSRQDGLLFVIRKIVRNTSRQYLVKTLTLPKFKLWNESPIRGPTLQHGK